MRQQNTLLRPNNNLTKEALIKMLLGVVVKFHRLSTSPLNGYKLSTANNGSKSVTMIRALGLFLNCWVATLSNSTLRSWSSKTLFKSFLVAIVIIFFTLGLGSYFIFSYFETSVYAQLGTLVWILSVLYFSGALTMALMGALNALLANEKKFLEIYSQKSPNRTVKAPRSYVLREYKASVTTFAIVILSAPFFLFPPLIPLGVVFFAYALGNEALTTGRRLSYIHLADSTHPLTPNIEPSFLNKIGIGLVPAMLTPIPVLAVLSWPALYLAGFLNFLPNPNKYLGPQIR